MKIINYDSQFKEELNSWNENENKSGFSSFVCAENVCLGDYLDFVANEMGVKTMLAFDEENLVGFVSIEAKNKDVVHIEIVGVNPKFRGQGYSKKILLTVKKMLDKKGVKKITLAVKKENTNGIKAFSKFAKNNKSLDNENYLGFEI